MALKNTAIENLDVNLQKKTIEIKLQVEKTPYRTTFSDVASFRQKIGEYIYLDGIQFTPDSSIMIRSDGKNCSEMIRYSDALEKILP